MILYVWVREIPQPTKRQQTETNETPPTNRPTKQANKQTKPN